MTEFENAEESFSEIDAVEAEINKEEPKVEVDDEAIPDHLKPRLKGKGRADLARIIDEQERMISKQANEVGEVRRLADELLRSQLTKPVEREKPKEIDFFENPQEAIRQAVDSNPKVLAAEQYSLQVRREQSFGKLLQKHPDTVQMTQNPDFVNWVNGSKVRAQLFQQANANWDTDAADELMSTYKQLNAAKTQQVSKVEKDARDSTMKAAAVDAGGSGESSKKSYRRADLINLRIRDPLKYEAMLPDIERAYSEGRVR